MQLGYEKLLNSYNIEVTDLDEDVQIGIKQLEDLKNKIQSKRKIGQTVTSESIKKIKFLDSSIIREILDYIDDNELEENSEEDFDTSKESSLKNKFQKEKSSDSLDEEEDEEENEEEDEEEEEEEDNDDSMGDLETGNLLDSEFNSMFKNGMTQISLDSLRSNSPTSYEIIWSNYDNDDVNGIETSNYTLIETEIGSQKFNLKKK